MLLSSILSPEVLNKRQRKKLQDRGEFSLNIQLHYFLKNSKTLNHEEERKNVVKLRFIG